MVLFQAVKRALLLLMCFLVCSMLTGTTSLTSSFEPQRSIPVFASAQAGFTIMTFNIHHGEGLDGKVNLEQISDLIRQQNADVIALQEVDRYRLRSGFVDQAKELAERLHMYVSFAPSLTYSVGQYGNALLSRYPIQGSTYFLLPGAQERRSLLLADILIGAQPIRIAATHLGLSNEDRRAQLSKIAEIVSTTEGPLVLAGDFNEVHTEVDPFWRPDSSVQLSQIPFQSLLTSTFIDGKKIDYLFANIKNIDPAWTVQTISSDHFPVMAFIPLRSWVRV
ncbi:endonuclease/exonuclease/phosphatase family protein [Paenibacillus sp. N3.4]|uniref:endonuclease/exonuclease/phosphatase family protein n=1 Tax=Paenibacillus sp. N3.4 TaxID=2603222 RepID=UPI0011CA136C|nr:endonuclease/exonuclease/phosphatase family protein [Paenibacillus sp. N3.4]TXK76042.1 hypothetical protein FU659_26385 [Paenibacillus sp. N3.4]